MKKVAPRLVPQVHLGHGPHAVQALVEACSLVAHHLPIGRCGIGRVTDLPPGVDRLGVVSGYVVGHDDNDPTAAPARGASCPITRGGAKASSVDPPYVILHHIAQALVQGNHRRRVVHRHPH